MNEPVPTDVRNAAPGPEPVAVVGLACRLPGADDPAQYWQLLAEGRDAVTDTPDDRRTGAPADGWPTPHGATAPLRGGHVSAPADFDAAFFGISPREADAMDPQARLALELGWEALEHAGIPATAAPRTTAVYLGADTCDYADVVRDAGQGAGHHTLTGLNRSLIANRLSYALGVSGPSMTVDSAQSSSLTAVQLACDSLRLGDSDLALAGGVHLNLSPDSTLAAAQFGALSPDGACHTFDARANGYVRGEGGGVVVLKLLSRALADGDHVHAVIRGGALNNDGTGTSITTPDADAQAAVLRAACHRAGVDPADIGYVELHGTGTRVGDPVEAAALGAVLGTAAGRRAPLAVGSVKTNIGHLEGAAGIAGLLKTVLCLAHRRLVPSLHHEEPNPAIDLDGLGLRVQRETTDWTPAVPGAPLRAGVSSFGMGGTNVHLVLEEAPATETAPRRQRPESGAATVPWLLSAATPEALRAQTDRLTAHVRDSGADPVDTAWSLLTTRAHLAHRAFAVGADPAALLDGITTAAPAGPVEGGVHRLVFVFPGQGSQWPGMAAELLATSPAFAARLAECADALAPHVDWDLAAVLRGDPDAPPLDRSDVVQPVLWAVMVSLAAQWRSYGIEPAAVVGHSQGEIAAAVVAGALSLADAALVVALRSKILVPLEGRSGMVSLALAADDTRRFVARWGDRVTVAALNGSRSTVVSADIDTVTEILATAERENVRARRVGIDYASHSPHVEPVREEMLRLLAPITPRRPDVPFLSTVTGDLLDHAATDARYWYANLRNPVLLDPAVRALTLAGHGGFVEVSPHPVLTASVQDTVEATAGPRHAVVTGTLRRGQGGPARFQTSLAALWARGADVDWTPAFTDLAPRRVPLPTYAFQRRRHWIDGASGPRTKPGPAPIEDIPVPSDAAGSRLDRDDALALVRDCAAVVLGHTDHSQVDPQRTFRELGVDSVTAVELRDRINALSGADLPATAVYEYPTPARLAEHLTAPTAATDDTGRPDHRTAADEPIAIVSMGCRFPGGVRTPEDLWRLVRDESDAITAFPTDRGWDLDALYDPDPDRTGTTYVREGGFLHDAGEFDAAFFGISPREATAMDPQQRLLLETTWETVERAGLDPRSLQASPTGVFVGATAPEYGPRLHEAGESVEGHVLTGTTASVISGRIAYALGLEGPAVTVDTACSSSLVALHLAVRALRAGDCSLAIAAGATVMSVPGMFVEFGRQRGLAADGRCKPFAADADGTNWAEGVGVLLLERLSDARANGHQVLGVVRGSAINQDGASNGLTAPNGPSQQRVIRAALADAGLSAADVDVVEAHGTGTRLGDPIEAQALLATYGQERAAERPLWLGSLKSNIGHAQAAAGVGGVIKMVQAMRAELLPKSLYAEAPSPLVDWESGAVELLAQAREWAESDGRPRRAGVSSFGISGTNAHVILEAAPDSEVATRRSETDITLPWLVSARTPAALTEQENRLAEFAAGVTSRDPADPVDVAWSLWRSRSAFECRSVVVAGEPVVSGSVVAAASSPVFVFPGQGAQWVGMAVELLDSSPVFAARFEECAAALDEFVDWSLVDVVRGVGGVPGFDRVDVVQPVLWAVMVSLAALWESFGVRPAAVVGHSQGEIAAAVVAGALSVADGARVVALRSRAITALAGLGGMVSVALAADRCRELADRWPGRVSVAAVNGPVSTVVSGDADALDELVQYADREGVRVRRIEVDYASHSAHVESIEAELAEVLGSVTALEPSVPFLSTVTGQWVEPGQTDGGYWYRNLRQTVQLAPAVSKLVAEGHGAFLEMSPHPVLTVPVAETVEDAGAEAVVVGSLRRGEGGLDRFFLSLGEAWAGGVAVDWTPAFDGLSPRHVELPTYPFQRSRYWLDVPKAQVSADPADEQFWRDVEDGDLDALADTIGVEEGLDAVVPALAAWRTARRERGTIDGWRYRTEWRPLPVAAPSSIDGTWLLVVPEQAQDDGLLTEVLSALEARGGRAVVVAASGEPDRAAFTTLPAPSADYAVVLSFLALDERPHPRQPAVALGLAGTLTLVQALGDAEIDAPLWCVTRGAVGTGPQDPPTAPAQAGVWGLGRVAALEHPKRWGGLVDLPPSGTGHAVDLLLGTVTAGTAEDQVALRDGTVYGRRLVHAATGGKAAPRDWKPRGTVLVTGGTGALGAHVARWLAARGAEHLVLTGRKGDGAHLSGLRDELASHGTRLTVAACDTADRDALADLVDGLAADGRPVRSVVHAAGVSVLGPLAETGVDDLAATLSGKVLGAAHLDEVLDAAELDAVVYFSSISGTWGVADHAAYGAANAILDARAERRRADGAPVLSVAWGPWAGGGMIAESVQDDLRRRGVPVIQPGAAVTGLQQALDHDNTVVVVADVDWRRFAEVFTSVRDSALLTELTAARQLAAAETTDESTDETSAALRTLTDLPPARRLSALRTLVASHVAAALGHADAGSVNAEAAFKELGFDSLTAVALRDRLHRATGLKLPTTVVFDHPSISALTTFLDDLAFGGQDQEDTRPEEEPTRAAGDDDPIAIVSMGCRFPGGVRTPDDLWRLVLDGVDAITPLPTDRGWDLDALYDPDPERLGTSYVRESGFLDGAAEFDAAFFGISPREATAMDPQQRLLLETSWETLERAGIDPRSLRGSSTGVYVGLTDQEYATRLRAASGDNEGYLATGAAASVASGRIAYALGLEGPAVTVDTACSSSLVALHLAVRALRAGDCRLALAGAATVMSGPGAFVAFGRQRALAADGRCKPFAADADGFALSEGVGVLLLERLSDARVNGHQVVGVVRGSAINQDGASNGLTAPNGPSQQRVIRAALADAGLSAADVDVVEAHGTGTRLGDPIEAQALLATYGQERAAERPLWLGSVKSNIGHTQAASGMAGIIKMVQAMRHGTLPKSLRADEPSPIVDWQSGAVELLAQAREWAQSDGRPRRAGVSSFGISGTNAHVVIEAPQRIAEEAAPAAREPASALPFLVSARTEEALTAQVRQLNAHLEAAPADPVDVAWSLWRSRSAFECRSVVVAGEPVVSGSVVAAASSPVFVFPGQGAQWVGMAVELLDSSPVFAARFEECAAALDEFVDWSLVDVVRGVEGAPGFDRVDVVQPVLWAVMVSLAALWESFGVRPAAVMGHSQGEIAAAVVAGALSVRDGARVVALRSRAITALAGLGGMVSVALAADRSRELADRWPGRVSVAAVNGPASTVVSGDADALDELVQYADRAGVRVRRIEVDYASHSAHVESIEAELAEVLGSVTALEPSVPFLSTVTGQWVEPGQTDGGYWYRNLRQTVQLAPAVSKLVAEGHGAFLEMSPHPVLTVPVAEAVEDAGAEAVVVGSLRRGEGGLDRFFLSLGEAWAGGVAVDWTPAFDGLSPRHVELPTYPFQRSRYWLDVPKAQVSADPADEQFWRTVEEGDLDALAGTLGVEEGLDAVVPALAAWRTARRERHVLDNWRYRVTWRPFTTPGSGTLDGDWLLVVPETRDGDELTARIRQVLEESGAGVVPVVVPGQADHAVLAALLDEAVSDAGGVPAGVLSLLALDVEPDKRSPGVSTGLLASMALSQALSDTAVRAGLWTVTRGAVTVGVDDEPAPNAAQAAVWGLLRVAALEDPERAGGLVDLPLDGAIDVLSHLPALLAGRDATGGESEFALRTGVVGVRVRRMARSPLSGAGSIGTTPGWKPRGTVLITGGTGALGAHVARDLAREGAEHLVLTSRRGPDAPGASELEREVAELGCQVTIAACDVADRDALAALLDSLPAEPALTAVVHTAGAVDEARPLTEVDADEAADLMHAKVVGAENLHDLLAGHPLDAFVLFSSGAGVWGNGGQAPYAAANAHLDALAERWRAAGLPATSIAWGAWAGGGMVDAEVGEQLLRRGVPAMEPRLAVRALREFLAADDATVVVADIRWDRFVPAYCVHGPRPLIDDIPDVRALSATRAAQQAEDAAARSTDASGAAGGLRAELAALPPAKRKRRLAELIRTHVTAVLGAAPAGTVKPGKAFRDMGFDSLTAVELRNRLGATLGTKLSATLVFDHPTPNALADHLGAELFPADDGADAGLDPRLREIEAAYRADTDPAGRRELVDALRGLLDSWATSTPTEGTRPSEAVDATTPPAAVDSTIPAAVDEELVGASDQDMFDLIDKELGIS